MAADESYGWHPNRVSQPPDLNAPLPPLPRPSADFHPQDSLSASVSPFNDDTYRIRAGQRTDPRYVGAQFYQQDPFTDDAAIPLQQRYSQPEPDRFYPAHHQIPEQQEFPSGPYHRSRRQRRQRRAFFSRHTPWVTYILTFIQVTVFIAELIRNAVLTGSPIEIHPSFNPMIGPSSYVLINMGGRYVPCMRAEAGIQDSNLPISWPCPNQTDSNPTCTLSDLCGFSGVPIPVVGGSLSAMPAPNQWYRFILPIFLHAGIVHIGFNMLLQVLLGSDMEKAIGHIRFALVYFSSGIFGFVMGGNFAPSGIVSTGASGSLFGIIALLLLDLLYTWPTRPHPFRELLFLLLDIAIAFVLGLLPGLDNFSHIGGFLCGLVLGICILRSPAALKSARNGDRHRNGSRGARAAVAAENSDDHDDGSAWAKRPPTSTYPSAPSPTPPPSTRPPSPPLPPLPYTSPSKRRGYYAFTLLRLLALGAAITCFALLLRAFYAHHSTECGWCKYLSCLPIRDWCDVGQLTFTDEYSTGAGNGTAGR